MINHAIDEYIVYLTVEKGSSTNTIEAYSNDVRKFALYLENENITQWHMVDNAVIRGYLANMQQDDLTNTTRARNVAALKSFFRFLYLEKYTEYNVNIDPLWVNIGGGVEVLSAYGVQMGLDYRYQYNNDIQLHNIRVSGSYRF